MEERRDQLAKTNLWDHLAVILKWKKLFMIVLLITMIGSLTYSLLAKKWYFSDAQVMPPPPQMMGLMGSLLQGLDLGLLGDMTGMSTETKLIAAVIQSRRMQDRIIDRFHIQKKYKYKYRKDAYKHYFRNVNWELTEAGTIYLRINDVRQDTVAIMVNYMLEELTKEYGEITAAQARNQREFMEARLKDIEAEVRQTEAEFLEYQERTGVIAGENQLAATVEAIANVQTQLILAEVQAEVMEKTMPASSSLAIQAREQAQALREQLVKMKKGAEEGDRSVIIGLDVAPQAGIEYLRLFRELEVHQKVLEVMMPMYEQSKIFEYKDAAMLYVLDEGRVPEKKYKPKRALVILAFMFLAFILTYVYVLFIEWYRRLAEIDAQEHGKVKQVLEGLRLKNLFSFKE